MVLKLWCVSELHEGLLKQIAGPWPLSYPTGPDMGFGTCISNKFPGDADAIGSGATLLGDTDLH